MTKAESPLQIHWLPDVEEHDYPAAQSYLRILCPDDRAAEIVAKLRNLLSSEKASVGQ
jgi:hypothetical protein